MTAVATDAPPLSVAQEALWYASVLDPRRLSYNETVSIRKDGPLDVGALRRAFDALVRRHAPWRSTFATDNGRPIQVTHAPQPVDLPVHDLSELPFRDAEARAVAVVAELARVPFDLRHGPLVRPRLFRFPGEHHRLYLNMHHIVFDGVSLYRVVLAELVALYEGAPLDDLPAEYADYARWEQAWMEAPRAQRRLDFWRDRLAGAPELALPHDRPRPPEPRHHGAVLAVDVPAATVDRLRAAGQARGASLFQVLAAAWAVLLARWADAGEVVFATAADLRRRPEFEGLVGYCLTPLALRVDLAGDPAFADLVVRVRNELLDGLDHLVPFERVVRDLAAPAEHGGNPVYQTMIVLEPAGPSPAPEWSLHQLEAEIGDAVATTKLDLELELDERPEGRLAGRLIYDRDLFDPRTAERLADGWSRTVTAVATDPSLPVSRVPVADEVGDARRIAAFNATTIAVAPGAAANLAAGLADLGLGPQDTVLVLPSLRERMPVLAEEVPRLAGARLLHADAELEGDGRALSRLISREGVTFLAATPDRWRALIDSGLRSARSLRAVSAGGPLPRDLADAILARCRALWTAYGTPVPVLAGRVEADGPVIAGRPLANAHAAIIDRHGRPAPVGAWGELHVCGRATGDRARWLPDGTIALA